jgi:hypothetical protein
MNLLSYILSQFVHHWCIERLLIFVSWFLHPATLLNLFIWYLYDIYSPTPFPYILSLPTFTNTQIRMEMGTLAVGDPCMVALLSLFHIWIKLFLHLILDCGIVLWNSYRSSGGSTWTSDFGGWCHNASNIISCFVYLYILYFLSYT